MTRSPGRTSTTLLQARLLDDEPEAGGDDEDRLAAQPSQRRDVEVVEVGVRDHDRVGVSRRVVGVRTVAAKRPDPAAQERIGATPGRRPSR